jgi:hypothetical protein
VTGTDLDAEPDALVAAIAEHVEAHAGRLGPASGTARDTDRLQLEGLRFDELAQRVVVRQYERIEAYRKLWSARGLPPPRADRGSWRSAPPVPASAFKEPGLELWTAPPRVVFRSSGTSAGAQRRSEHHHPHPDLYRGIVEASFPGACFDAELLRGEERVPMLSLIPPLADVPDSSLGFMVELVLERWAAAPPVQALGTSGLDAARARGFLAEQVHADRPVLLLSTALALSALLDALAEQPLERGLPAGSVLFETGGFKGRERELSRADLVARTQALLGIGARRIVREYGMTELTSQAYTRVLHGGDPDTFHTPPWLAWRLLDPASGGDAAPGEEGLIAFFDLGNVGSIAHLLTEDVGRAAGDGGFVLLGRARDAQLRGCSLTAEELLR